MSTVCRLCRSRDGWHKWSCTNLPPCGNPTPDPCENCGCKRESKHHPARRPTVNMPRHIIESGARALFERDCKDYRNGGGIATPDPWEQQSPADQLAYRKRASAVIRATSKRIWDSGYEAGKEDAFLRAFGPQTNPQPVQER